MTEQENEKPNSNRGDSHYTSEDLQHLSDLEHVRERPSMYIGDTTARGLHHLVYEVVDNSIDEAMAGYAKKITVTINTDGSVTVEDDGRGIPVDRHEQLSEEMDRDVSTLEGVMTVLKFGGKFEKGAYQTSGGLHGVGVTVVNFLLRMVRGRSLPRRARATSRNTSAACRTGRSVTRRHDQEGRHQDHVQTRPADLPDDQVHLRHAAQTTAGTGVPESGRADQLLR